jgi:aryl-alcohol dehydrogenase-like predicted oxidoreductase
MRSDPPGARFTEYKKLGERQQRLADRFLNDRVRETVTRLKVIADDLNVTLTALCVAWSKQHDFVASTIIGATTVAHLNESLAADGLVLSKETLARIDEIDVAIPNPMKEDGLRKL